jgi:hypothetical protein
MSSSRILACGLMDSCVVSAERLDFLPARIACIASSTAMSGGTHDSTPPFFQWFTQSNSNTRLQQLSLPLSTPHKHPTAPSQNTITMSNPKQIFVAVVGVGGVGKAFLSQLEHVRVRLSKQPVPITLSLVLVRRSTKQLFNPDFKPLSIPTALDALDKQSSSDLPPFPTTLETLSKAPGRVILVDNTSDQTLAETYPSILAHGISIVTPNKKAPVLPPPATSTTKAASEPACPSSAPWASSSQRATASPRSRASSAAP